MAKPKIITDATEYNTYVESHLQDAKTYQESFQYGKAIEKLDPNMHIKGGGKGGGHIIQDELTTLEQREYLRFRGDAVLVEDVYSASLDKNVTRVTINHQDIPEPDINPYGRDDDGYFKLPVGTNMY